MSKIFVADNFIFENKYHKRDKNTLFSSPNKFHFSSPIIVNEFHIGNKWRIIEFNNNLHIQKLQDDGTFLTKLKLGE